MKHLARHRSGVLALCCVIAGALLVLVAADVRTWRTTVARDDLRFRVLPAHRGLWKPATLLPGDPAGLLLGTGDTLDYRRSLQLFWYSRIGSTPESRQDLPTLRAETQQRLEDIAAGGRSARERSFAAMPSSRCCVSARIVGRSCRDSGVEPILLYQKSWRERR